jgi:hypothetical protein
MRKERRLMMIKPILLGATLSLLASSAALALPNISAGATAPSAVLHVDKRDHDRGDRWRKRDWDDRYSYEDRDRYRGKHRYSYRPRDWEERGCFSVGPFWYCS